MTFALGTPLPKFKAGDTVKFVDPRTATVYAFVVADLWWEPTFGWVYAADDGEGFVPEKMLSPSEDI